MSRPAPGGTRQLTSCRGKLWEGSAALEPLQNGAWCDVAACWHRGQRFSDLALGQSLGSESPNQFSCLVPFSHPSFFVKKKKEFKCFVHFCESQS